ncbi:MAG: fibrobacter succinogenes major paralogous domain-containing protein [Cytophagaceae bacterium]|jgi:uncharacterized protein (TIGR02145 family)|nr:fibrobacter succinogenes major paralogous domain-containing protein [Cytophagaceae bacterium]
MKLFRFLLFSFAVFSVIFTGCQDYDDSDIRKTITDHENRIADLESAVQQLDAQLKAGALISSVTEIDGGWHIEFTGGTIPAIDIIGMEGGNPSINLTPVIEVRDNADGTTTIWVDYGDGFENTGVDISAPQGETGPTGGQGAAGITPMLDVRYNETTGMNTIWYNVTSGYPVAGWVDTGDDITGPTGAAAVTPIFRMETEVESGEIHIFYNTTIDPETEDYDTEAWVEIDTNIKGDQGAPGVSPKIEVRTNNNGTTSIWYNVTSDYPDAGWADTEFDISAIGPVLSILNNDDGTITITMNDATEEDPATTFVFERASTAVRFEIMTYEAVTIPENGMGYVRFVVNPSTAYINQLPDNWHLNNVGTRAPGYVQSSTAFEITGIAASNNGQGEYIAAIQHTGGYTDSEHIVALVLNTGTEDDPVLVSSSFFSLVFTAPIPEPSVITIITQPKATTDLTEWNIPANTNLTVEASVTQDKVLSYQWYRNDTAIDGAQSAQYTIPTTTEAGTYYYFVEVMATGGAATVRSEPATVNVTADRSHQDLGVVINGVTWATRNVGNRGEFVSAPSDYGNFYDFEDAQSVCPAGWRTPTQTELANLNSAGSVWVSGSPNGRRFGPEGNTVFIPAAGFDGVFGTTDRGDTGSCWSSSTEYLGWLEGTANYSMDFTLSGVDTKHDSDSGTGNSVRCVKAE